MHFLDKSILDRIGRDVDELVHHVGDIDKVDDAGLLARPEVLPPAKPRVLTLGQELVEMLCEHRDSAVAIEDHGVVVLWGAPGYVELRRPGAVNSGGCGAGAAHNPAGRGWRVR